MGESVAWASGVSWSRGIVRKIAQENTLTVPGSHVCVRVASDAPVALVQMIHKNQITGTYKAVPVEHLRKASQSGLSLRVKQHRVLVLQASNDTVRDSYGTIITVEGLHQWAEGFLQHRTISQQHNRTMRGIAGKPQVAHGLSIDFTPQLEVEVRVDDDETWSMIENRKLTGGSLEFIPLERGIETRTINGQRTEIYHELSSEPELCGLTLTDLPAVPNADILELRTLPNWAYAVIDPSVLNGQVTDLRTIEELRWFPHHDPVTHQLNKRQLEDSLKGLEAVSVSDKATLSKEEIIARARAHLARHQLLN